MSDLQKLNERFETSTLTEVLAYVYAEFGQECVLASSLGLEDQLLTHHALEVNSKARIFVLDTGRLHQETYDTMAQTRQRYGCNYEVYFPDTDAVQTLLRTKGPNSFYDSIDNRKECCGIRKTQPLKRVLSSAKAWITGLRREQSVTRTDMQLFEHDQAHGILKVNPLINWTFDDVKAAIDTHGVPYNALHDQGYPSIGCAPCTRAVKPGEDSRAGRWWWEEPEHKECGLHIVDGKLVPMKNHDKLENNSDKQVGA